MTKLSFHLNIVGRWDSIIFNFFNHNQPPEKSKIRPEKLKLDEFQLQLLSLYLLIKNFLLFFFDLSICAAVGPNSGSWLGTTLVVTISVINSFCFPIFLRHLHFS